MAEQIFISYSRDDRKFKKDLEKQLSPLRNKKLIALWSDEQLKGGAKWENELVERLNKSTCFLLLISANYLNSNFCQHEASYATAKANLGLARVIPIILSPCHWEETFLSSHQALPKGSKPIETWGNQNTAWVNVIDGIKESLGLVSRSTAVIESEINKLKKLYRDVQEKGSSLENEKKTISNLPATNLSNEKSIRAAIKNAGFDWTLIFAGERDGQYLNEIRNDLESDSISADGSGKRFASGFSYWGIGPTLAWQDSVSKRTYRVAYEGILEFPDRWRKVLRKVELPKANYISLGAGTGEKDSYIYAELLIKDPKALYFPVDMTFEMLKFAVKKVSSYPSTLPSSIFPIKTDFSKVEKLKATRRLLNELTNEKSNLFSLLGNTIANFDEPELILQRIINNLMKSGDYLALELAWVDEINEESISEATKEYSNSTAFRQFALSALLQNTDLDLGDKIIDMQSKKVNNQIQIKAVFPNHSDEDKVVNILGGGTFMFTAEDTIRLYLTRKFTTDGMAEIIKSTGLEEIGTDTWKYMNTKNKKSFGLTLIVLKKP